MPETFHGPWSVMVFSNPVANPADHERFLIAGSAASDGTYPGVPGTELPTVSGPAWIITMQWRLPGTTTWSPTDVSRAASYTVAGGLVVHLSSDDDNPVTNMVLMCRSLDPSHHPMHPIVNSFDFTVSREAMARYRRRRSRPPRGVRPR